MKLPLIAGVLALACSPALAQSNGSVGTVNQAAPGSATQIGVKDGSGKLQPASSTNPVPVAFSPSSGSGSGVAPVVSSAVEACHVFKASAGNLYGFTVNTTASATANDWIMLFNATSAPVDGAVTPVEWARISATTTFGYSAPPGAPLYFSTGIVACLSTTGPLTKTAEAQAVFSGKVQ